MAANQMMMFPREIGLKRRPCNTQSAFKEYVRRLLGKSSCYTSLFSFTSKRADKPWKFDYTSAIIDKAWWDFDSGERGDIDAVKQDVAKLLSRLHGDVSVVATGRGFHVYQFFDRSVTGHGWRNNLNRYQRAMAKDLTTLDGVGLPEKLVRIPNTYNPTRGRWAVPIDADAFMADPSNFTIPHTPNDASFSICPFLGVRTHAERFDLVRWVHDNPAPTFGAETHHNGKLIMALDNSKGIGDIPIPPCISSATERENPNHYSRIALVQHLSEEMRWFADPSSLSPAEWEVIETKIMDYIITLNWRDFNRSKSMLGIRSNMKYKQSPTCKALDARGMCGGKCWRYDGTI